MKNAKLYKERLQEHLDNGAQDSFMHYNGSCFHPSYYMTSDDIKELRTEYKKEIEHHNAIKLAEFKDRAIIIPVENGNILISYYTVVCEYVNGKFTKRWYGFSNTTLNHINIYRKYNNLPPISKYDWIMMD